MKNKTCAIVVTYNRLALLKECISALKNQTVPVNHIVIINNASNDGTKEYLNTIKNDQILVWHSESNVGGAGGFSRGIQNAFKNTYDDYFWMMDDDTIVSQSCNKIFLQKARQLENRFGFLSTNVRWKDGSPTNVMLTDENWPDKSDEGLIEMEYGSFVSFFISRESVSKIGLPIEDFFIWGDDSDYSLRLKKLNPGYFVIDAHAVHKSISNKVTPGIRYDSVERVPRYFYYYRNQMYIWKKHYHKNAKLLLKYFLESFIVLLKSPDHKLLRFRTVISGLIASISFNPQVKYVDNTNNSYNK